MAKVSIITRTRNRAVFLNRALLSISSQSYKEYEWIVVNDGGENFPVDEIGGNARSKGITVIVIHNDLSLGMEAASNSGISKATGKYIAIHDDDDSWHPEFLSKSVAFLENDKHYMGVVSRVVQVIEKVSYEKIKTIKKYPINNTLGAISISGISHPERNYPPISFLFHRSVFNEIGLYREDLPVLGDWEFNLRFIAKYDIGLISEYLANYHIRKTLNHGVYANTIIGNADIHSKVYVRLLNELLRHDIAQGIAGIGWLVNLTREFEQNKNTACRENLLKRLERYIKGLLFN